MARRQNPGTMRAEISGGRSGVIATARASSRCPFTGSRRDLTSTTEFARRVTSMTLAWMPRRRTDSGRRSWWVTNGARPRMLSAILWADWGKEFTKRAVYVADVRVARRAAAVSRPVVRGRSPRGSRTVDIHRIGLATFDAPLGVPESYLTALGTLPRSADGDLSRSPDPGAFDAALLRCHHGCAGLDRRAAVLCRTCGGWWPWNVCRCGCSLGVDMYRQIDRMTGAKAVFIKSGIPGSVGSAACALWQELAS